MGKVLEKGKKLAGGGPPKIFERGRRAEKRKTIEHLVVELKGLREKIPLGIRSPQTDRT